MTGMTAPARTRPRDRKQTILATAARLFAERGYHNVGTNDIADAVGIRAGALYRHVENKQDLLEQAVAWEFEPIRDALRLAAPSGSDDAIRVLGEQFGARRHAGLLWSRETRHLGEAARERIRALFFDVWGTLTALVARDHPDADADVRALAVIAVLTSPAYHATPMARDRMIALTTSLALAARRAPVAAGDEQPEALPAVTGVARASRSAVILDAATRLFSTRGYQTVTMQDIGDAVGATSASLYRHYETKGELLTAIVTRGTEVLNVGLGRALASAASPAEALQATVASYAEFAVHHRELLGVFVAEIQNIPEPARHGLRRGQHDYVEQWITLLTQARPELDRAAASFRVHAALAVINDISRTSRLSGRSTIEALMIALAASQLWDV